MNLVGDIGGTKTLLALADSHGALHHVERLADEDYPDFPSLLDRWLQAQGIAAEKIEGGCLAVAGPIADDGQAANLTNRPWLISLAALEKRFGLRKLKLANDFAAAAMGVTVPTGAPLHPLQAGIPIEDGLKLVIGAGTGLGVASLIKQADGWRVLPGEGGHVGFAPQDERQDALNAWMRKRHGRVIAEHLVSGVGLAGIHEFLQEPHAKPLSPSEVAAAAKRGDPLALSAFDLFASIYGAVAGDYALAQMARGGVYLAGGIVAANIPLMQRGAFLTAFKAKGVHAALAEKMPVHIVTEPLLGLYGASRLV